MSRAWIPLFVASAIVALPHAARGEATREAETLFEEGRLLMARNAFAEACPKLERSEVLDPGIGTEFHLARCYELAGRLASAKGMYERVAAATHAAGQSEREAVARGLAAGLEPRLSHMRLRVADSAHPGLVVRHNGAPMDASAWSAPIALDPGAHVVEASAPDTNGWKTTFTVDGEGQTITIDVPMLSPRILALPRVEKSREESAPFGGQRLVALLMGGAGLAGVGVGSYFGLDSMSLAGRADPLCPPAGCSSDGYALRHDARVAGDRATVAFAASVTLLAGAVVVWLTAPHPKHGTRTTTDD